MLNRIFSIFLLITMSLNIVLPMIERICNGNLYEILSLKTDDTDENGKNKEGKEGKETNEKEEKIEFLKNNILFIKSSVSTCYIKSQPFSSYNKLFISEKFVITPEQPPEV
jgi:hypothetical protein